MERRQAAHNNVARVRKALLVLALAGGLGFASTPPAVGAGLAPPVADCSLHGQLTKSYTASQLKNALNTMPADVREYSDCYNVIQRALLAKIGHLNGDAAGGGGGSFLPIWLIVVIALLVLGGLGFAVVAARNRGQAPGPG